MKKRTQNKAFTLVELLVVISIIAILAGLSFPAISSALAKARQGADVSNARQLGTILFTYASDNNFKYPAESTAINYVDELIQGGYLNNYEILVTSGSDQEAWNGSGTIGAENISYGFMTRSGDKSVTDNAHDSLPLIFSRDSALTAPGAAATARTSVEAVTLTGDGPWTTDGVTVFRKGNSASFVKARNGIIGGEDNSDQPWIPVGYKDGTPDYTVAIPTGS